MGWQRVFTAQGTPRAFQVEDLQQNCRFAGGFGPNHPVIRWLWEVLAELDEADKSLFLFFSTSCSRAPLLGLGTLDPPFCIQVGFGHCPSFGPRLDRVSPLFAAKRAQSAARPPQIPVSVSPTPLRCPQRVDGPAADQLLPSSSTCLHILRLPSYSSKEVLRAKLLYAIREARGFGLT